MIRKGWVAAAAVVAALAVAGLGLSLAQARASRAEVYARERAAQRRAAAATRVAPPALPPRLEPRAACVTGADGFAVAVERELHPPPAARRARRVAVLRQISEAAVRAEKLAALARPAPTLPKRMGLASGEPVAPARPACDGRGFAELR
jgi:hypothetical protein